MNMTTATGADRPLARAPAAAGADGVRAEPVIDPQAIARLRELETGGQQGVLQRVLHAYQTSLGRHLADIESARHTADGERLARAAHTLKSSSAAVGAMALSSRCAALEERVRVGATLPDAGELDALLDEGRAVLAAVGAMLAA